MPSTTFHHARTLLFVFIAFIAAGTLPSQGCSDDAPTTVLLRIERGTLERAPSQLLLSVYGDGGRYIDSQRVPEVGAPELPGEVVLYPKDAADTLRLQVEASDEVGAPVGYGVATVTLIAGSQTRALVVLQRDVLADGDGDGVPDVIDNCPARPNPDQAPCQSDGGPQDGGPDSATPDRGPDTVDCDKDGDGYLSQVCGGDDCNDKLKSVHPGADESGPGSPVCQDGIDNDCDGKTDIGELGCHQCETSAECDDVNDCTHDSCAKNLCQHTAQVGKSCDDGDPCTTSTRCQADGSCGSGAPVTCPPAPHQCQVSTCDSQQGCVTIAANEGGSCDDGITCTEATCQIGSCVTDSSKTFCYIDGVCYPNNHQDPVSGCHCLTSQSTTSWSASSTQCLINGKCVNSGQSAACSICDPTISKTSYASLASCQNAIVLVGANDAFSGNLGGVSGANAKCEAAAAAVGLKVSAPAFIGTKDQDATTLLLTQLQKRKVVNGRGQTLYNSWSKMLTGATPQAGFYTFDNTEIDEPYGAWDDADAWTGMDKIGAYVGSNLDCKGWQSSSNTYQGGAHELDMGQLLSSPKAKTCNTRNALLCVWVF